jgi:hypothetical protein
VRYDTDRMVEAVSHDYVADGSHHHAVRSVEARGGALPVFKAPPPDPREDADSVSLGH